MRHHVALSVVGTDRLAQTERGYFFAKDAQETLIKRSATPYSIVHATQFFEFVRSIELELRSLHDPREVVADPLARYFGTSLAERELLPDRDTFLFETRFVDWLARSPARA